MKVTKLKIKNIGMIADTTIDLNKPLLLFYGEIKQGKTTILNAIRWCFGGAFPDDIIRHEEKEASVELEFDGGVISRSWYKSKSGKTEGRAVAFIMAGKPVKNPVSEIKRFLNPFLLDQDYLRKMTELERKKFFVETFAVDTTALDTEAFNASREAQALRSRIDGYGEIDLTPVPETNIGELRQKLADIRSEHAKEGDKIQKLNMEAERQNSHVERGAEKLTSLNALITELEGKLKAVQGERDTVQKWLNEHPTLVLKPIPTPPDTAEIERQIEQAAANEVRRANLVSNKERAAQKAASQLRLSALEGRQREIKKEKIAKLAEVSANIGVKDLAFDESGNFTYQGTDAGMLSTSQIMRLSSDLSAIYPEGLGIELMDRAESLGKSIFEFIDRAKEEEKTILATIVGEAPAKCSPEIGVFVVEAGKVKAAQPEALL